MPIEIIKIKISQYKEILSIQEGHFADVKDINIKPAKLTKTISAFANADGGELYVGIHEDKQNNCLLWQGFNDIEAANGHLQVLNDLFTLGEEYSCVFLSCKQSDTLVLYINIQKTRRIKTASDGKIYIRHGAQNLPVDTEEKLVILQRNKGLVSFESEVTSADLELLINSDIMSAFLKKIILYSEPEIFLTKQGLTYKNKPTVCGVLLFSDLPQAIIPKHCGVKIYRYKTHSFEGKREVLDFNPITIEGCIYNQIHHTINKTVEIIENLSFIEEGKLIKVEYPHETLHEIITNAVLHRDYSIKDDIHIRIYENRIEVESPGKLPGHITEENILEERFSRNSNLVRIINKFPEPPNKDIGEGLNTAFREMQKFRLRNPVIKQEQNKVVVYIYHQSLASLEETILKILETETKVTLSMVRKAYYIETEYQLRKAIKNLVKAKLIEKLDEEKGTYVQPNNHIFNISNINLSSHQIEAISSIENALIRGSKTVLISIPVVTSLNVTGVTLVYKFLKENRYKKIFYLVSDTNQYNIIVAHLKNFKIGNFGTVNDEFEVQELKLFESWGSAKVYVGKIQDFIKFLNNQEFIEINQESDCIILHLDTLYSKSYETLNSLNIPIICLSFVTSESLDSLFGNQKVYAYSIPQAINDGYWLAPELITFNNFLALPYFNEETEFNISLAQNFDASILALHFNQEVCKQLLSHINIADPGKTVIFCKNIQHAKIVTDLLRKMLSESYDNISSSAVVQITSDLGPQKNSRTIHQFRNEIYPKFAVTVELLDFKINVPQVCNLVFIRPVQSEKLYQRMLGIAAQPCPDIKKQSFRIFDFVGLYHQIESSVNNSNISKNSSSYDQIQQYITDKSDEKFAINYQVYLEEFEEYLRNHIGTILSLKIAIESPWNLTRVQYKTLEDKLEDNGFSRDKISTSFQQINGTRIEDSIVGFIRHTLNKEKLISYSERVGYAISKIQSDHNLNPQQQKWIERIKKQLQLEYVVDYEAFDRGAFAAQGGYHFINKVFEGRLMDIMTEINIYIWQPPN